MNCFPHDAEISFTIRFYKMKSNNIPARYVLAFMGFWGTFTTFLLKTNISVAIVEMVIFEDLENPVYSAFNESQEIQNYTTPKLAAYDNNNLQCPDRGSQNDDIRKKNASDTKFRWNGSQQGLVLGSFSYGVVLLTIPMTYLSRRYGHVRVQGVGMLCASVMTLLSPIAAEKGGYVPLVIIRVMTGMCSGSTTSQMFGLAGMWAPPQERSKIVSFMLAGVPFGISCAMPVTGLIASSLGWQSVFYLTGALSACWAIVWLILIHERPEDHPRISPKEMEYIQSSLNQQQELHTKNRKVPWLKIFKSGPFICIVIVHFCSTYGRTNLSAVLPTYLKAILKLDTTMSGILSAVPFAMNGILLFACGAIADYIISKKVRPIIVRKTFTVFGLLISAAAVTGFAFCGCNIALAVTLATFAVAMDAFVVPGFKACLLEIAPEYSGILFGMSATISNTTGMIAPQVTGVLRDAYGFFGWQIAFWLSAIMYFIGAIEFGIFGTNKKQPWTTPEKPRLKMATVTEEV